MTTDQALFVASVLAYGGNVMEIGKLLFLMNAIAIALSMTEGGEETAFMLNDLTENILEAIS